MLLNNPFIRVCSRVVSTYIREITLHLSVNFSYITFYPPLQVFSHDVVNVSAYRHERSREERSSRTINKNDNPQFQEINVYIKIEVHDPRPQKGKGRLLS